VVEVIVELDALEEHDAARAAMPTSENTTNDRGVFKFLQLPVSHFWRRHPSIPEDAARALTRHAAFGPRGQRSRNPKAPILKGRSRSFRHGKSIAYSAHSSCGVKLPNTWTMDGQRLVLMPSK
jgi:hypothetical protein